MAENLKTTKYRNGDLIGTTTPATGKIIDGTPYQWAYQYNESNVLVKDPFAPKILPPAPPSLFV